MTESYIKVFSTAQTHLRQLRKQLQVEESKAKCYENFSLQDFWIKLGTVGQRNKTLSNSYLVTLGKSRMFGMVTEDRSEKVLIFKKRFHRRGNFQSIVEYLVTDSAVKEVSQISTQIAKAHRKSSVANVKELQELMNSIEAASDNLVFVFHTLPQELGRRFHLDILKMTKGILTALVDFIQSLNVKESKSARETLKYAENVHLKCEEVQKMPKNNLESVLRVFHREELCLLDALQEIDEEVKSNFSGIKYGEEIDNTEMWNNQDKELLPPCVTLVKTARFCLKKVISSVKSKGDCSTVENIYQLDEIAFIVEDLTVNVDNFVSAIYPPMNQKDVKQCALKVVNTLQNLLTRVQSSHFVQDIDQSWLNALFKSVDHNNNKLQPLFSDEKYYETTTTDDSDEDE